jgi:Ca2+-transporting ATPase
MITSPGQPHSSWYALSSAEVARQLDVDPAAGLAPAEAAQRLQQVGPNALQARRKESGLQAFLRQYKDFMQVLLVVAAVISFVGTGELGTTLVILGLTVFNAVLGLRQESKAQASLAELTQMMKTIARVRRGGQAVEIDAAELVPGDVVLIEAGNRVPGDGRLFVAAALKIEEAALTGESVAAAKHTAAIGESDVALGDRVNMAYMNTAVTRGRGEMIVTTTGMDTEMGHIADLLNKTETDKTPLQKQLDRLVLVIAAIAGVTFLIMLLAGLRQGQTFSEIFVAGIALAIAAIPTGMPVVVTTLYSLGTRVLAGQNAIVKRLPSVETLGSVSAICSDKTGTLTLNKMTAVEFSVPGRNRYKVTGEGYGTAGEILHAGGGAVDLDAVLLPLALCADARLDGENLIGDPTEGALIVLAEKGGISVEGARQMHPRGAEVPFDSEYKFMATFHKMQNEAGQEVVRAFVKGAPDVLIARAGSFWLPDGKLEPITGANRQVALGENARMAEAGERVMVVARRDFDPATFDPNANLLDLVTDLTLLAMVGIVDPPRPEAKDAIARCRSAGIRVRMITGDHAVTAAAIGKELGITGRALTGAEFAAMPDEELLRALPEIGVVARVAPEDKIRLVELLQRQQNVVAMTGDGVNDAPALKKADIGVAMGITGTEVSKEAAVMILTDDNFATIVKAVEYGRGIYANISKYIRFQMTTLVGFIAAYLGAALLLIANGVPFSPLLVLAINFLVQVPLAIALGYDKPAANLMAERPRPLRQPVLARGQWLRIGLLGVLMAAGTLSLEMIYAAAGDVTTDSLGYVAFSLFSIAVALSVRSETASALDRGIFGDRLQVILYGFAFLLTLLPTEMRFFQRILGMTSLTLEQWLLCLACAVALLLVDEVVKYFLRRRLGAIPGHAAEPVA